VKPFTLRPASRNIFCCNAYAVDGAGSVATVYASKSFGCLIANTDLLRVTPQNGTAIKPWLETKVRRRDKFCVYCRRRFALTKRSRRNRATWEHRHNDDIDPSDQENIALCCGFCNASKGAKKLLEWLESPHCKEKKITKDTVAPIVQRFIRKVAAKKRKACRVDSKLARLLRALFRSGNSPVCAQ